MVATYDAADVTGGFDARSVGTLTVVDECVVLVNDGSKPVLLMLPEQMVSWDGNTLQVTVGGAVHGIGDEVAFDGGGWEIDRDEPIDPSFPQVCADVDADYGFTVAPELG